MTLKQIGMALTIKNGLYQGIDFGTYPSAKTISVWYSINIIIMENV